MKKLLAFIFVGLFLISSASALEIDNRIYYEDDDMTIRLKNLWGMGQDYGTAELKSHTSINEIKQVGQGQQVVMYYDFDFNTLYENGLGEVKFIDMKDEREISKDYQYVYWGVENYSLPTYEEQCTRETNNSLTCIKVQNGSEQKQREKWLPYTVRDIPSEKIRIGIRTNVEKDDHVDGIWAIGGKEITKHATWTANLNVGIRSYWKLNESGTGQRDDSLGLFNGTLSGGAMNTTSGIIAGGSTGDGINNLSVGNATQGSDTLSISAWIQKTGAAGDFNFDWIDASSFNLEIKYNNCAQTGVDGLSVRFPVSNCTNVINGSMAGSGYRHIVVIGGADIANRQLVYIDGALITNISQGAFTNLSDDIIFSGINPSSMLLDEVGIWTRALTSAEVVQLFNSGVGITFDANPSISGSYTVTLNSPPNNTQTSLANVTFNATGIPLSLNTTNATLFLYNASTGEVIQNPTVLINQSISNDSIFNLTNLDLAQHNWSVLFCGTNNTGGTTCDTSESNFTFTIGVEEINSFFVNETIEGDINTFQINISVPDGRQISTNNLHYNNTINLGTRINIGGNNFSITTTQTAPLVTTQSNISFFWNITLDNGIEFNSVLNNQSVIALQADDCTVFGTLILNYTLQDEGTQVTVVPNGNTTNSTMQIDVTINSVGTNDSIITFSQNYTNTNPAQVCLNQINDSVFDMDAVVRYEHTDHVVEFNNIQNFTLQNSSIPQNINLLDLATVDSQEFLISFKSVELLPVASALIDITRKYISEGVFKTVELPLTDDQGQAIGHLVLSDEIYTFVVSKDGVILGTFNNVIAFCDNQAIGDCKISLNVFNSGFNPGDFQDLSNISLSTVYDRPNTVVTTQFSTTDGSVATLQVNGTLNDALGNTTVCSDFLTSSSGTLICTIPASFGNSSVLIETFKNGELIAIQIFSTELTPAELFGGTRIVLLIIIYTTLPLMALTSAPAALVLAMMGLIMGALFNIYDGGTFVGAGSTFLWFVIAAGVLFWKMTRKDVV